jgi:redox-sensing transcriptional repressor
VKKITKYIIKKSLKRILHYRASLLRYKKMGIKKVFSYMMGHETGVSPDQVRKDFSEYKLRGCQKGGYKTDDLLCKMDNLFHQENDHNIILVGMGNIGRALVNYNEFIQMKINIVAGFDIDPSKQSTRSDIPVYSLNRLEEIVNRFRIRIAIIAVPESQAQDVCDTLLSLGIIGILNFATIVLKAPEDIIINNVNLCYELESVIYYVMQVQEKEKVV